LLARVAELQRALHEAEAPGQAETFDPLRENQRDAQLLTQLGARLHERSQQGVHALAQLTLELALEKTHAADGFLLFAPGRDEVREPVALPGAAPPQGELARWAQSALVGANEEEQTEIEDEDDPHKDLFSCVFEGRNYRAIALRRELGLGAAFGVLALGFDDEVAPPSVQLVRMFAAQLAPKTGLSAPPAPDSART
jgi:hypothetical protein